MRRYSIGINFTQLRKNWTEENAKLCHEFVIDAIIKLEKVLDQKIKLITYFQIFIEEIKAIKEQVDFVDELDVNPRAYLGEESRGIIHGGFGLNYSTRLPIILFKLRQGEIIKCYTFSQHAPKGWTFVYGEEIREKCASKQSYAYVKSSEIEVKIIKRETTALSKGNLTEIPKENQISEEKKGE